MKAKLSALTLILLFCIAVGAQEPKVTSPLKEMVETEQAFSKAALDKSTREAFMDFIAEDGLLFRPGAVNGKKWMTEHPVPPSNKKPLLAWQPVFAKMAAAGDLGFTTGPWEFKGDINDTKPSGYGHFVTLWKKQPNGSWRFVLDLGISHPESGGPLNIWKVEDKIDNQPFKPVDVAKTTDSLLKRDAEYASHTLKEDWSKAFMAYAAADTRLYLPEHLPYVGLSTAVEAIKPLKTVIKYVPGGGDVSQSGDLGYTHGTYEKSNPPEDKVVEKGNYLRIWRKQGDTWQIVLDVTNPVP